jgi:hypothetical protein
MSLRNFIAIRNNGCFQQCNIIKANEVNHKYLHNKIVMVLGEILSAQAMVLTVLILLGKGFANNGLSLLRSRHYHYEHLFRGAYSNVQC